MSVEKLLFLLILFKMCFSFAQEWTPKKIIVIDVGHGGFDTGAIGINGLKEKEVVLNIAKEIIELNRILNSQFDIYLTRYRDTFVSLADRGKLAKALKADLFVSLHCNAANYSAKGMEVYAQKSSNKKIIKNLKKSIRMGQFILTESSKELQIKNRGLQFENFQVLRETIRHCPAVLIETGYLSNKNEAEYYTEASNTRAIALAILLAIYKNFKTIQ
jgi:N-acetylmuramoyl-L-alanine amidase